MLIEIIKIIQLVDPIWNPFDINLGSKWLAKSSYDYNSK